MRKRKIAVFLTSVVMALSMAIPANAGELDPAHITDGLDVGKYGDVNLDGKINVSDTVLASAYLEGKRKLYGENLARTDINNNFIINVSDVVKIAAHVKGIKKLGTMVYGTYNWVFHRSLADMGGYAIQTVTQNDDGSKTFTQYMRYGNDYRMDIANYIENVRTVSYMSYVLYNGKFYTIDRLKDTYNVAPAKSATVDIQGKIDVLLGKGLKYKGERWTLAGSKITLSDDITSYEVYESNTGDNSFYVYNYFIESLSSIDHYDKNGNVKSVEITDIHEIDSQWLGELRKEGVKFE